VEFYSQPGSPDAGNIRKYFTANWSAMTDRRSRCAVPGSMPRFRRAAMSRRVIPSTTSRLEISTNKVFSTSGAVSG
jgi:hypothetical protein